MGLLLTQRNQDLRVQGLQLLTHFIDAQVRQNSFQTDPPWHTVLQSDLVITTLDTVTSGL